jgi:flagellar hook-associated protein 1
MGGLFTSLLNSTGALQVYGRVFNVIQNNITNANTPGYAKQDQSLVSMPFDPSTGLSGGVIPGAMLSSRSLYLEQAVRDQTKLLGAAQQKASDLSQIQPLFDVSGQSGVPTALNQFFNSFSQLSVNPNDQVSRLNVIDAAKQVAEAFNQNAIGIQRTSSNVDSETRNTVTEINTLANQIAEINKHYRANSQASSDAGLDAQLHTALESLSQLADYSAIKTSDGTFSIYLGGQTPLVIGDHTFTISADFSSPQTVIRDFQGSDATSRLQAQGGTLGSMLETKNSILPGYQTTLDTIAQTFADAVNTALSQGVDRNGAPPSQNLFSYNAALGTAFTLNVTTIAPDEIAAASAAAPGGNGNAIAVSHLANAPIVNGFTVTQAYGNLGAQVGRDVSNATQEQTAQTNLVNQAKAQRAATSGVSLDEEAAKILQFQQAYQAVGKLVTVLDGLSDTIMQIMG